MKIVFMGTPDFAVPCLDALKGAGHEIAAVFTRPDKPKGRGYTLTPPPVKVRAEELGIPVYQPTSVKDGPAEERLREISADVIVVVAYGRILPPEILNMPKYGCVNVHASLLPRHRGASPIQWSLVCGDKVTGVTTMKMDVGMDTGDILETAKTEIDSQENCESLHDRLSEMGAKLIVSTLEKLQSGEITSVPQPENGVSYAPIIKKEMGLLDFSQSAEKLHDLIRGFYPWPAAYTFLDGRRIKVLSSRISDFSGAAPGEIVFSDSRFIVGCFGGALEFIDIQPEGRSRMKASDYIKGHASDDRKILG